MNFNLAIESVHVASAMPSMLDLERFRATPLTREPFEFLIVPEFVKADARSAIHDDYPGVDRPGSFPLGEVSYGSAFARAHRAMRSDEFRRAFEEKFNVDLANRPDMITVRGRCSEKDGKIHTDSETKIITILIYMNAGWESAGGRLRLLRSGNNLMTSFSKFRRRKGRCWRSVAAIIPGTATSRSQSATRDFSLTGLPASRGATRAKPPPVFGVDEKIRGAVSGEKKAA